MMIFQLFNKWLIGPTLILLLISACKREGESSVKEQSTNKENFATQYPQVATGIKNKVQHLFSNDSMGGDFLIAIVDENGLAFSHAMNRSNIARRYGKFTE